MLTIDAVSDGRLSHKQTCLGAFSLSSHQNYNLQQLYIVIYLFIYCNNNTQ